MLKGLYVTLYDNDNCLYKVLDDHRITKHVLLEEEGITGWRRYEDIEHIYKIEIVKEIKR